MNYPKGDNSSLSKVPCGYQWGGLQEVSVEKLSLSGSSLVTVEMFLIFPGSLVSYWYWNSQAGLSIKHIPAICLAYSDSLISHSYREQKMINEMNCVGLRWAVHVGCWLGKSWNSCCGSGCRRAMAEASPEPLVHFRGASHRKAFADFRSHCGNPCLRSSFSEMCACAGCILWEQTNICNPGSRGRVSRTQAWRQLGLFLPTPCWPW